MVYPIEIMKSNVTNWLGVAVSKIKVGNSYGVYANAKLTGSPIKGTFVFQIKDPHGIVISLTSKDANWLITGQVIKKTGDKWVPQMGGTYTIEVYIWKSWDEAVPLAKLVLFTVSTDIEEQNLIEIIEVNVIDETRTPVSEIIIGEKYRVQGKAKLTGKPISGTFIFQVKDQTGVVISLSTEGASWIYTGQPITKEGAEWTPKTEGTYTVEIYIWISWDDPSPLSDPYIFTIISKKSGEPPLPPPPPPGESIIHGEVYSSQETGLMVETAEVILNGSETITAADGTFSFLGVESKKYTLYVAHPDYEKYTATVDVSLPGEYHFRIPLIPKGAGIPGSLAVIPILAGTIIVGASVLLGRSKRPSKV